MKLKLFWTPSCSQCPQQKEVLEEFVDGRADVELEKVNAVENPDEANKYGVRSAPVTIVERDDGQVVKQFNGFTDADAVSSALA